MVTQVLLTQKEVAAIQYAVLGKNTYSGDAFFDAVAGQFRDGSLTPTQYISNLLASTDGVARYSGKTDTDIVKAVYASLWGSPASDAVAQTYLSSGSLSSALNAVINNVLNYNGFDSATLLAQNNLDNALNAVMFKDYGTSTWIPGAYL